MKVHECFGLTNLGEDEVENNLIHARDRYIGLEKELESMEMIRWPDSIKYWRVDEDGSLRNNGRELKFTKPLKNNGIILAIKELDKLFKNNFSTPTHSIRTSDHFHVNIRDFNEEELKNLHQNIMVLEQTLFNLGKLKFDRKHNPYCIPHWVYFQEYTNAFPGESISSYFELPKYLSMGFNARFGTIEFRMFESSTTITEILRRINTLLELVDNSKHTVYTGGDLGSFARKLLPKSFKYISRHLQESPKIEKITREYIPKEKSGRLTASILLSNPKSKVQPTKVPDLIMPIHTNLDSFIDSFIATSTL